MSPVRQAVSGSAPERARHRAPSGRAGRHRAPDPPSLANKALRTTGVTAALVGGGLGLTALPASAATANDFYRLRMCESGNNYAINTGNGFYGAYQFDAQTWRGLGYSGLPHQASPATQDEAAYKLYNARGWSPWPACSAELGLGSSGPAPSGSTSTRTPPPPKAVPTPPPAKAVPTPPPAPPRAARPASRPQAAPKPRPLRIPSGPAPYGGTMLSTGLSSQVRTDTLRWQVRMRRSRFMLTLDGRPQSAGVATLYSYLSGVKDGRLGVVGPRVWSATVNQPSGL